MTKIVPQRLRKSESVSPESASAQFDSLMKRRDEEQERDPFLWLDRLIGLRTARPAEIATAISQFGIYGMDQYGRFGFRKPESPEARRALEELAKAHAAYRRHGTYQCDEIDALQISDFGWPSSVCPDFEAIRRGETLEPKRGPADSRPENANLAVIGALLLALKGKIGGGALDGNDKDQPIIDVITQEVQGYGLCRRTLQDKFAAAKRLVKVKSAD